MVAAFSGPGAPRGVRSCTEHGFDIVITFDDAVSLPELIDDLITIETLFVAAYGDSELSPAEAAAIAATGLGDPDLTVGRILEMNLEGLR